MLVLKRLWVQRDQALPLLRDRNDHRGLGQRAVIPCLGGMVSRPPIWFVVFRELEWKI